MSIGMSSIENHRTVVMFTAAASGNLLVKGDKKTGFVDGEGQSAAGGYTINKGDTTIVNQQLQSQESALLKGMQVHVTRGAFDEVVPAAEREAFLNAATITLKVAGMPYDLGKGIDWRGPIETGGLLPFVKAFAEEKRVNGSSQISVEVEINKTLTGGVVANKTYALWFNFPSLRAFSNEAAIKN